MRRGGGGASGVRRERGAGGATRRKEKWWHVQFGLGRSGGTRAAGVARAREAHLARRGPRPPPRRSPRRRDARVAAPARGRERREGRGVHPVGRRASRRRGRRPRRRPRRSTSRRWTGEGEGEAARVRARSARRARRRGAVGPPRAARARGAGAVGEWRPWVRWREYLRRLVAERRALEPRAGHSWIEDSRRWRPNGVGDSEIDHFLILVCHDKLLQILFLITGFSLPPAGGAASIRNFGHRPLFLGRASGAANPSAGQVLCDLPPPPSRLRLQNREPLASRHQVRDSPALARSRLVPPRASPLAPSRARWTSPPRRVARFFITPGEPTNKPSSRPPPAAGADARLPPPRSRQDRKMAQTPTFKLILVGDGGTGTRERPRPRRTPRARRPRGRAVFSRSDRRRLLRERLEALAVAAPRSRRSARRLPPPSRSQARPRSSSAT